MAVPTQYAKLLEPGRIGKLELKNRIVMLPMGTRFGGDDGFVNQRILDYYEARAKGGAGLITIESTCIDFPIGKGFKGEMSIDDDKFVPGLTKLAQVIKRQGAKAAMQLHHAGNDAALEFTGGLQPVGPSAITRPGYSLPRELTVSEIKELVARFARGAERAKKAGFDGVEIHGGNFYLIAQFLSPYWNKRRDDYGGTVENRARFLLETIKAVREALGPQFPLWCRLNGIEAETEGGITIQETQEVAKMAQRAGVDAISVSAVGRGGHGPYAHLTMIPRTAGSLLPLAEAVKKVVTVPVIAAGRLNADVGEKALRDNKADFIGMGRELIADPEIPNKIAAGRRDEIVPCIACYHCLNGATVVCAINPAAGKEQECILVTAEKPKKVMVVGSGPAGMEAALVAASRGHKVTLYEKDSRLGGQLLLAALPPEKGDKIEPLTNSLIARVRQAGVKVKVGTPATLKVVEETKPDAVIIATGTTPFIPNIPGIKSEKVVLASDVLTGKAKAGQKVVVIGGNLVGCEVADFLTEQGKKVTIVEMISALATTMPWIPRKELLDKLANKGIALLTNMKAEEVTDKGLVVAGKDGAKKTIEADTVVVAAGARPDVQFFKEIEGKVPQVYLAGDCAEPPGGIKDAIAAGARIARGL